MTAVSTARVRKFRARKAAGIETVRCDLEVAPGLFVTAIEIRDDIALADHLVAKRLMREMDTEDHTLLIEGAKLLIMKRVS